MRSFKRSIPFLLIALIAIACEPSATEPEEELCPDSQLIDSVGFAVETGEPALLLCNPIIVN